ncbi:unnamed protein product [Rotaria magnacalcarata]|uniref:Tetraspanin n=1 Tax=Rotaria magnacalcarata TaxID=392030 RepID=A0A817A120_9BILA|nr:unnamed protein product [Rotaria magnacalcarata]CAF1598676.1 unnamed protein product [Rotaria magnacalcarata]CAF2093946.1 unnamed protein product [Rotaria magnacalcarata]CAF2102306.1 unnamed protein product [Rotaria magnacalcarata]CAF2236576.1 unnamed protein product [Rotaria magnacalcarata]
MVNLSGGSSFIRGVLLVLNVLFVIIGLILIGVGIYIKVDNDFASILNKLTTDGSLEMKTIGFLAFVMIGGGVFTLLLALLGCMGALWKSRCFLYLYAIILILLMILELVGIILALVYKGKLKQYFEEPLFKVLDAALSETPPNKAVLSSFGELEKAMKCCGVHNISDYERHAYTPESSACKNPKAVGCSQAIIDWFNKNLPIIGGTLGGILVIEFFGLISACLLASAIKNAPDSAYSTGPPMPRFMRRGRD